MTENDRTAIMPRRFPLLAVACLGLSLVLSGCGEFRQAIGMDRSGPDEFAVESRAPLTIPPDFDLRPPQPGAPRPQEKTAAEKARSVIDTAGPGEPGKQASAASQNTVKSSGTSGADPSMQVSDQSLAQKLLGSNDTATSDSAEKRETSPLKGVY